MKKFSNIQVRNPLISGAKHYAYTARYVYRNGKLVNVKDLDRNGEVKIVLTDGAHGAQGAHQNG